MHTKPMLVSLSALLILVSLTLPAAAVPAVPNASDPAAAIAARTVHYAQFYGALPARPSLGNSATTSAAQQYADAYGARPSRVRMVAGGVSSEMAEATRNYAQFYDSSRIRNASAAGNQ